MNDIAALLGKLEAGSKPEPGMDGELVVELVFDSERAAADVQTAVEALVKPSNTQVATAMGGNLDRFFFVRFVLVDVRGQEADAFAFARLLKRAVGAIEGNVSLPDSLYGEVLARGRTGFESSFFSCSSTADPSAPPSWHHAMIETEAAWKNAGDRGAGVKVGVIDTGFSRHPELADAYVAPGINLIEPEKDARDQFSQDVQLPNPGHGTLVGSVIASRGDIAPDGTITLPGKVTGVAPKCTLFYVRAVRSVVDIQQSRLPRAIKLAVDNGCHVIVMCLGGPSRVAAVEAALRYAVDSGVVVVCAAGNCYPFVVFPAAYAKDRLSVAVAAIDQRKKPWEKTARGNAVTISSPGEDVWGAHLDSFDDVAGVVRASQGTTLATSMTAGVAALWVAKHGLANLKAAAAKAKLTVQELFMRAVVHGLTPPKEWNGANDLGRGVLNAKLTLSFDILAAASGFETAIVPDRVSEGTTSTLDILRRHVRDYDQLAAAEIDDSMSDVAAELIWRSYRKAAVHRFKQSQGFERATPIVPASEEAASSVAGAPNLRALLDI